MIHVVGLRAAQRVQAAEFIQRLEVLRDLGWDAILRELLADRAVQAFGRGTVVAPDVEDERVIKLALPLDFINDSARVVVSVLGETCEDFHEPALEGLFVLRNGIPGSHRGGTRRELRVLWNPAELLLAGKGAFAIVVPAVVEFALILVRPFLRDLVGTMRRARSPIHEEWFVGCVGPLLAQPLDGVRRDVLGKVVAFTLVTSQLSGVAHQGRFVLRGFSGEEAVEILETVAARPVLERPLVRDLFLGCVVPFAPGPGIVAVVLKHFGDRGRRLGDGAAEPVEVVGQRGDLAIADARVIAPVSSAARVGEHIAVEWKRL